METASPLYYHLAGEELTVLVVDDDESVSEALPDLLRELGFSVQAFSSAEQFSHTITSARPVSDPQHRHAGHVRTRSPTGIDASPERDSDRLHHRSPR